MEPLQTPPVPSSFIPLADHQSRTPSSFHSGPPVLHYHSKNCQLVIQEPDLRSSAPLLALRDGSNANAAPAAANGESATPAQDGTPDDGGKEIVIEGLDVWVTSDKFLLYNPALSSGLSVPYPSISLHAIQRLHLPSSPSTAAEVQGLYMQIALPQTPAQAAADDEEDSITLTVVPPVPDTEQPTTSNTDSDIDTTGDTDTDTETPTQKLYGAVSACANLHPDPVEPGDEDDDDDEDSRAFASGLVTAGDGDGGMPPPVDGSSGWITAENMHEFFDEEGNWIAGGEEPALPLGPGAGNVHAREGEQQAEGEGEEDGQGDGQGGSEETKWRRTE